MLNKVPNNSPSDMEGGENRGNGGGCVLCVDSVAVKGWLNSLDIFDGSLFLDTS
jgi:hypothetical protein